MWTRFERYFKARKNGFQWVVFLLRLRKGLLRSFPLRNAAGKLSCTPFYIIGSGRSGNTLLRALLASHSDVGIPPEFFRFYPAYLSYQTNGKNSWEDLCTEVWSQITRSKDFDAWGLDTDQVLEQIRQLPLAERGLDRIFDQMYQNYLQK